MFYGALPIMTFNQADMVYIWLGGQQFLHVSTKNIFSIDSTGRENGINPVFMLCVYSITQSSSVLSLQSIAIEQL